MKKKICVFIGGRANYSSIKSAMCAISDHSKLELQVIVGASAILDRYGDVSKLIENDGFKIDAKIYMLLEGETPETMAKSTGIGLLEFPSIFNQLKPDIVITVGDRFETMATTLAAAYMNIPIAHTMGGEVSGTIDESIRHAVTKFAHIHFPACEEARNRIIKLGEEEKNVHLVGCPRIDLVADILKNQRDLNLKDIYQEGVGIPIDLDKPFLLVSQHPVTTEYGTGEKDIRETLLAVKDAKVPAIVLWPNADAGSEDISRGIRKFREEFKQLEFYYFKNLPIEIYVNLMNKTKCLIGNSSSAIREGAFIGTPSIDIGSRQNSRQKGKNVVNVHQHIKDEIYGSIMLQLSKKERLSESIYGSGDAGKKIANILADSEVDIQKQITF